MPTAAEIDAAVAVAEAETGVRGGNTRLAVCAKPARKARVWTEEENRFVRENLGRLSDEEMGRRLGRTWLAVRLHRKRDLHLTSPSRLPTLLTAEHIAVGLGLDGKSVHLLIDRGLMPGRRLPFRNVVRVVDRLAFLRWIYKSKNWVYFKPQRIGLLHSRGKRRIGDYYDFAFWEEARELVRAVSRKWKDRWLTPGQVARRLRVRAAGTRYVNVAIRNGALQATRWGNWWVLQSDLPGRGKSINYQGRIVPTAGWR